MELYYLINNPNEKEILQTNIQSQQESHTFTTINKKINRNRILSAMH